MELAPRHDSQAYIREAIRRTAGLFLPLPKTRGIAGIGAEILTSAYNKYDGFRGVPRVDCKPRAFFLVVRFVIAYLWELRC